MRRMTQWMGMSRWIARRTALLTSACIAKQQARAPLLPRAGGGARATAAGARWRSVRNSPAARSWRIPQRT